MSEQALSNLRQPSQSRALPLPTLSRQRTNQLLEQWAVTQPDVLFVDAAALVPYAPGTTVA